jgi:predicted RND superfamily exporter protein
MLMQMRADVKTIMATDNDMQAFPFSSDALYWEENGIIDFELIRNLIICGGVIIAIISVMIPNPRVSIPVILGIFASIVDVLAMAHYWGCTINSVVSIYLLISVGLAVDYSAHIGHVFLASKGPAVERAHQAFTKIGPSVFHAIISTVLAVMVLAFSKSFVFVTFFKLLFLVTFIAGSHGLLLLPAVLSLVGGDLAYDDEKEASVPEKIDNSVVSVSPEVEVA